MSLRCVTAPLQKRRRFNHKLIRTHSRIRLMQYARLKKIIPLAQSLALNISPVTI
jgi:hypothetical protein